MSHTMLLIIFSVLLLPGLVFTIFTLPGVPYMFLVALIFAILDKFQHFSLLNLIILGLIALTSIIVNFFAGFLGAKYFGASKKALIFGLIGFIIGLVILPPLGGFVGLFLAIMIIELINLPNLIKAIKIASGSLLGSLAGIIIELILGLIFIGLFISFALK